MYFDINYTQAYNDPGRMVGVAESSENGTKTVYMDKSFLLERVQGVLQVPMRMRVHHLHYVLTSGDVHQK